VAQRYLDDGSIDDACPPIRALLYCMAQGHYQGKDVHHQDIRAMFSRETLLASDWYRERLITKQKQAVALWQRHCAYLESFLRDRSGSNWCIELDLASRLEHARKTLTEVESPDFLEVLACTLGMDPSVAY
jgi:hypothetical protein